MDHIPAVQTPVRPTLLVPYLSQDLPIFDGGSFHTYPERCGIDIKSLDTYNLNEVAPFLQEWLFFGLMTYFFEGSGVTFQREDFILKDHAVGQLRISTKLLPQYLWYWRVNEWWFADKESQLHRPVALEKLTDALALANAANRSLSTMIRNGACLNNRSEIVLLSLVILEETLDITRGTASYGVDGLHYPSARAFPLYLDRLLRDAGWCVAEIESLKTESAHVTSLYYCSTFNRHVLRKDHSRCTEQRCVSNQMEEATYVTKHVNSTCSCKHHTVSDTQDGVSVSSILDNGGVPIIWISHPPGQESDITVNVQDSMLKKGGVNGKSDRYVAISHVWSDGMGNARQNSLPRCQLAQIQRLVNELYESDEPIPFWIDTLCVPLVKRYRNMAITRMSRTYRDADKVLVLDLSLRRVSLSSPLECMMHVAVSPWATRLWTFQEGVLAKRAYFRFSDGAATPDELERMTWDGDWGYMCSIKASARYMSGNDDISNLKNLAAMRLVRAFARGLQGLEELRNDLEADTDAPFSLLSWIRAEHDRILSLNPPNQQDLWNKVTLDCPDFPSERDSEFFKLLNPTLLNTVYSDGKVALYKILGGEHRRDWYEEHQDKMQIDIHLFEPYLEPFSWHAESAFYELAKAVCGRATSKADDETLCLGGIMGINVAQLLELHGEERMKRFLSLLASIPADFIFSTGSKLQQDGYRWAPVSILNSLLRNRRNTTVVLATYGRLTPDGLQVTLMALSMTITRLPKGKDLAVYGKRTSEDQQDSYYHLRIRDHVDTSQIVWDSFEVDYLVVLLHPSDRSLAAVASICGTNGSVTRLRFQTVVRVEEIRVNAKADAYISPGSKREWCIG
ncbi:hypothetical protein DFP73DRAFT_569377 [Morchella snyderi]|nr:hypothetical protein DFP73DRAFT_569377 [Morchella snyderi]